MPFLIVAKVKNPKGGVLKLWSKDVKKKIINKPRLAPSAFLLTGVLSLLSCLTSLAQEKQSFKQDKSQVKAKHLIANAVQVKITPKGMQYFESNLQYLLGNLGISFNDGQFQPFEYRAKKSLSVEQSDLPQDTKALVTQIRNLLTQWFVGFPLQEIKPGIDVGNSGYTATFNRFALLTDESLMKSLGKKSGAVLAIELELQELNLNIDSVRVFDIGPGSVFGKIGFDKANIKLGNGKYPLKVRVPFYVDVDRNGLLQFQVLSLTENLNQVDIDFNYQNFISPKVTLEVNGVKMELNQKTLEQEIASNLPEALRGLRGYLSDFTKKQLPALLNEKAKEALTGTLEEVNRLDPPGAPIDSDEPPFFWGLQLESLFQQNGIGLQLKAYVEDPKQPNASLMQNSGSRSQVNLNDLDEKEYDVAMALDRAMINRILQLTYQRGLFSNLDVGGPGPMRLTAIPTIDFTSLPPGAKQFRGETFIKIFVKARVPKGTVTGFQTWGLKDQFELSFDLIAKMRKAKSGRGVEIQLYSIDENSLWVNPQDLNFGSAFVNVNQKVLEKLRPITDKWKTKEQLLPGTLPLPPEVLGIKLDIDHLVMSKSGHLVMYLDYAKAKATSKVPTPEIQLENDRNKNNKQFLTIYYVNGRRASLSTRSDQMVIHEIRSKVTLPLDKDKLVIPPQIITKYGFRSAFNMLVFVMHKTPTAPTLENIDLNARNYKVRSMLKSEYDQYLSEKVDFIGIKLSDLFQ